MHTHLEQWAADATVPGEQLGVRCLAQGSHLSRVQFLPEPRFEPTTSGYKSISPFENIVSFAYCDILLLIVNISVAYYAFY